MREGVSMNSLKRSAALSLLAFALTAPSLYAASEPQVRQSGNISYISGGVSEEGRDSLQTAAQGFNLKLILATRSGAYLSDVDVAVSDAQGRRVLDAKSNGPWFYAKLPSGKYDIAASSNGTTVHKSVTVGAEGQNKVDLRWAD
jgi:hypothetical protein